MPGPTSVKAALASAEPIAATANLRPMGDGEIKGSTTIIELLKQNTRLTQVTQELSQRISELTAEIHRKITG